jgi:hypothetical protein
MKSERLNWFLTVGANAGVILGLVFLTIQIYQSTLATQATLHLDLVTYGREHAELLTSDAELTDIVLRGELGLNPLSPVERERFLVFTSWRMAIWETAFLNWDTGVVDDRFWEQFDAWYSEIVQRGPGYREWWAESRHGFDPLFREHVDRVIEPVP